MDRTATIKIGHFTGPKFNLETGVPQGACLSPTLFNIYVHDIPRPLPNTDYIQYADDITQIIAVPGTYSLCNFPKHFTSNRTTDQVRKQMENTDEHAQIPNTPHSPTHAQLTFPIITDEQIIPYTNKATVSGLTFSTQSITPQITTRRAIAMKTLNK